MVSPILYSMTTQHKYIIYSQSYIYKLADQSKTTVFIIETGRTLSDWSRLKWLFVYVVAVPSNPELVTTNGSTDNLLTPKTSSNYRRHSSFQGLGKVTKFKSKFKST